MMFHKNITSPLLQVQIRNGSVVFGRNHTLKIYGTLNCLSGKRMNKKNRVFFRSEEEARSNGFRACGHCLRTKYNVWKDGAV
jgi:methylphosphotriester-DNA--protein-cysteine methyltransferase